jgi:hypothetical protein
MRKDQLDHLFEVYSAERQDDMNALVVAFAIATAGLTYIIAAVAYLADRCNHLGCGDLPELIQLSAPAVTVVLVGFLVLNVAATRIRSVHLHRLEATLKIPLPSGHAAPQFHTDAGIVYRPDNFMQQPHVRMIFALITFISYGIVNLIMVGFTVAVLAIGPWTGLKIAVAAAYGLMEGIEVLGFLVPLVHPRFRYDPSETTKVRSSKPKITADLDDDRATQ